ncbi:MAG: flagellar protein FliS [Ignavibacteriaceae bacterium]|jgi:flagellar protein FliS
MYSSTFAAKKHNRLNQYVLNEITQATPKELLIKIYDFAIVNCKKQNLAKTNEALQVLISSLSFENKEVSKISIGLLKLYQYCQDQMRKKNYDIVYEILTELRGSWITAFNK